MSLHQKQYPEPEPLLVDPDQMRRNLRLLRKTLQETIDDYVANGGRGPPGADVRKKVDDALAATKEL